MAEGSVMVKMGAGVNTQASCPFTYGLQVGAKLYAQAEVPDNFIWSGARYDITGWEKDIIDGGTCPDLGSLPTKRSEIPGLPVEKNVTTQQTTYYSFEGKSELARSHRFDKRSGVYGPAFRIPVGNYFCPSTETGEDGGTDCSTIKANWVNDEYLTNEDDYSDGSAVGDVLTPDEEAGTLDSRALLEKRAPKTSSLCGIGIKSTYPSAGQLTVGGLVFLPFSPQHLSVSLPQAFFCSAED